MQIGKLIQVKRVLTPFFHEKLSAKLSYKLMKFVSKLETEENFYNGKMREIIDTYCEKDENGNFIPLDNGFKVKDGCILDCNKAISELDVLDVEAPEITFSVDELSEMKLSVSDMMALSHFITEE